jgi:hypothetical protein
MIAPKSVAKESASARVMSEFAAGVPVPALVGRVGEEKAHAPDAVTVPDKSPSWGTSVESSSTLPDASGRM